MTTKLIISEKTADEARKIAAMLSDRLEVLEAHIVEGMLSDGYEDDQWNGRLLIALKLRDTFKSLIDVQDEIFSFENSVLRELEDRTSGALAWDETGYADLCDEHTESHYLLDLENTWQVQMILSEIPKVSEQKRQRIFDELSVA